MRKPKNYWNEENSTAIALDYTNKRDFKKDHIGAYEFLRQNKLLEKACSHMVNLNVESKWTYEKCKEIALLFESRTEFKTKYSWCYSVAKDNNWLDDITSHMVIQKPHKPVFFTKEICQKEAQKYMNRTDFQNNSRSEYGASVRNKWLDEICSHMNDKYFNNFKWTIDEIHEIALKYEYRKDFSNDHKNAYAAARHNGWLDKVCSHMKRKKLPDKYWHNFENCKNEALKYSTKIEFIRNVSHVYAIALKNGWIDEICKHMKPIGNKKFRCIYSYEFSDNFVYVGLTYNIEEREIIRDCDKDDGVTKHRVKTGLIPIRKQLTEYVPVDEAIKLEGFYVEKYRNEGWNILNIRKTGGIGGNYSSIIRFNELKKIVENYKDLNEFIDKDFETYKTIKNSKWIDYLFNK